ncbi:hypothetical protein SAMN03159417_00392 [Ralstonia sp. NFACC01]|nr:hypothetical protein SAMN03159417_00392 [Ralstonia sp. NFACC01]
MGVLRSLVAASLSSGRIDAVAPASDGCEAGADDLLTHEQELWAKWTAERLIDRVRKGVAEQVLAAEVLAQTSGIAAEARKPGRPRTEPPVYRDYRYGVYSAWANYVEARAKKDGLTQKQLSELLHFSPDEWRAIKRGDLRRRSMSPQRFVVAMRVVKERQWDVSPRPRSGPIPLVPSRAPEPQPLPAFMGWAQEKMAEAAQKCSTRKAN